MFAVLVYVVSDSNQSQRRNTLTMLLVTIRNLGRVFMTAPMGESSASSSLSLSINFVRWKDENAHTVLIGDFGKVNVAYGVGVVGCYLFMNGSDLDSVDVVVKWRERETQSRKTVRANVRIWMGHLFPHARNKRTILLCGSPPARRTNERMWYVPISQTRSTRLYPFELQ